jgi:hypothetical protein
VRHYPPSYIQAPQGVISLNGKGQLKLMILIVAVCQHPRWQAQPRSLGPRHRSRPPEEAPDRGAIRAPEHPGLAHRAASGFLPGQR